MPKLKIEYDEQTCIGTTNCVSDAGDFFSLDENEYTVLAGGEVNKETGRTELIVEVDDELAEKLSKAETGCPVQAIQITKLEG